MVFICRILWKGHDCIKVAHRFLPVYILQSRHPLPSLLLSNPTVTMSELLPRDALGPRAPIDVVGLIMDELLDDAATLWACRLVHRSWRHPVDHRLF